MINKEKIVEIINSSSILKRLSEEGVCGFNDYLDKEVSVESAFSNEEDVLILRECCDGYFAERLDKNDLIELSKVFSEIAEHM